MSCDNCRIVNCTIANNSGPAVNGGFSGSPSIANSILWNNGTKEIVYFFNYVPVVAYSDFKGGYVGVANIDADPLFANPANNDYHLTWNSPCRDAGFWTYVTEIEDFENDPRIVGDFVDMGADEYSTHLYHIGDVTPGSSIALRSVGDPGMPVLLGHSLTIQGPPQPTAWGDLFLALPPRWSSNIGAIPANGILNFPITVPSFWNPGDEKYFQALIGAPGGPQSKFPNLLTLEVE